MFRIKNLILSLVVLSSVGFIGCFETLIDPSGTLDQSEAVKSESSEMITNALNNEEVKGLDGQSNQGDVEKRISADPEKGRSTLSTTFKGTCHNGTTSFEWYEFTNSSGGTSTRVKVFENGVLRGQRDGGGTYASCNSASSGIWDQDGDGDWDHLDMNPDPDDHVDCNGTHHGI